VTSPPGPTYRVLARAYRPQKLSELVGQDALVRTLSQAFATGRIAHAFLLSGIRGVGKTTTARIIARGLNCTGPDGSGGPTPEPCGVCASCRAIAEDRSLDVIETDAASHTGKDDIREIVEGVQYAPAASRFKVYIFDEVHMLSEKAWNSLLKTVEEPPPHVKFVFATTEVRKVPVTVLSRCQRFDLRRVEPARLVAHLEGICAREGIEAEERALALIARAAEGSVRDALSLLDQAATTAAGPVRAADVEAMLGLADRTRLLDLFEHLVSGRAAEAVALFDELYALGADPAAVVRDLLDITHWLTRIALGDPGAAEAVPFGSEAAARAGRLAAELSHPVLQRLWQMLLRGLAEIGLAPDSRAAAEMLLVRLTCVSDLPPPAELVRLLRGGAAAVTESRSTSVSPDLFSAAPTMDAAAGRTTPVAVMASGPVPEGAPRAQQAVAPRAVARPVVQDLRGLVRMLADGGEPLLAAAVRERAHPVRFEPGRIEIALDPGPVADLPNRLGSFLERHLGGRWMVVVGHDRSRPTLAEEERARKRARLEAVRDDPVVRRALETFPGATIVDIEPVDDPANQPTDEP
jgi:DNA polymerase-3 subunit gamma/tau